MSAKDYKKRYIIQNSVLELMKPVLNGFYLTGGTALGRVYLNHRFSEDLDFFVNADPNFKNKLNPIEKKLHDTFSLLHEQTVSYEDFTWFYIESEVVSLKIEFINDVLYRCGNPLRIGFVTRDP